jgi:O-antigen ligase
MVKRGVALRLTVAQAARRQAPRRNGIIRAGLAPGPEPHCWMSAAPFDARPWVAIVAAAAPSLLAYNESPSPTFLNQALAFALWAGFVLATAPARSCRGSRALLAALGLLVLCVAWSWGPGALPAALALSAIGSLLAALVMVAGGAGGRAQPDAEGLFAAFCWGWVVAGGLNIGVALIQVFAPELTDGNWIATSGYAGRAVGNLRQPNHLSSLLLWHCIAVLALFEMGQLRRTVAAALGAAGVFAVVLTASRTGLVSVLLLALWGLLDRRLSRPARWLLGAAPLIYLLSWLAMAQWAALSQHAFGGSERLAETDISSSRFAIWRDTLALIRAQPWTGVGWGEFNLAWTLTPSPQRPVAFFDHTHSLPLQLMVELGLPLATLVLGLLGWALWRGARNAWTTTGPLGTAQRSAMVMVAMIGLHSLLEYPLWYSYFLLPAAWAWGFALHAEPAAPAQPARTPSPWLAGAAVAVVAGAVLSVLDYVRVAQIFAPTASAAPLPQRIAEGQRSWFFAHHADYAAVTSGVPLADPPHAFDRATHYLLDTRLMMAWARQLAAQGRLDEARHIAERLREFRKIDAEDFFQACPAAASAPGMGLPFQCEQPQHVLPWRAFLAP